MRHQRRARRLGRTSAHRKALYRNLVTALLEHERIQTTDAKAKELRRVADRMITLGKRGDLHARRQALAVIRSKEVTAKVFADLAERYRERPGGYTRVMKLGARVGDAAPISIVELVDRGESGSSAGAESGKRGGGSPRKSGKGESRKRGGGSPARGESTGSGRRESGRAAKGGRKRG